MPTITIVIPNLNSPIIDQTLSALRAQAYDMTQVEILVVGLDEPGLVHTDSLVRFISTGRPAVPAVARNIGIRAAQGELICFTDADCIPGPNWLERLTSVVSDNEHINVAGGGVVFPTEHYWSLGDNVSWFHEFVVSAPSGTRDLLPSLNLCVHRNVIEQVGLFNEAYPRAAGEDSEWTTRMRRVGHRLHFVPQAIVYHQPRRSTLSDLLAHGYVYGRYSVKIQPQLADFLETPLVLRHWWTLLLLAPLLAVGATARIYSRNRALLAHLHAAPAVFFSKMAWCWGAVHSLLRRQYVVKA